MPEETRVRTMRAEDIEPVTALCDQLGYPARAVDVASRFAVLASLPGHALLVADAASEVVGWLDVRDCLTLESEPSAEIGGLVVDARFRGRGVGTRLLEAAEQWARDRGHAHIRLRSNVVRLEAHGFYRARGYEVVKTQLNFRKCL